MSNKEELKSKSIDSDMPEPKTKNYDKKDNQQKTNQNVPKAYIKFKQEFINAIEQTIGLLPYDRILGTPEVNIKVCQIMDVLNKVKNKYLPENAANEFIEMIAKAPYNIISGVMNIIRTNQSLYFEILAPKQLEDLLEKQKAEKEENLKKAKEQLESK